MIPFEPIDCRPFIQPEDLTPEDVDDGIWAIVQQINASGWLQTAQSCAGHPENPHLRLVCKLADADRLMQPLHKTCFPHLALYHLEVRPVDEEWWFSVHAFVFADSPRHFEAFAYLVSPSEE